MNNTVNERYPINNNDAIAFKAQALNFSKIELCCRRQMYKFSENFEREADLRMI